jgi:serine/threonine protein kinase
VSPATDIYALGCVFIECLTGAPPFGGRPSMRVLFAHLQDPPPDLTELRPDIPAAAARAVNRALEKEPEERPASAAAYVQAVARAAA